MVAPVGMNPGSALRKRPEQIQCQFQGVAMTVIQHPIFGFFRGAPAKEWGDFLILRPTAGACFRCDPRLLHHIATTSDGTKHSSLNRTCGPLSLPSDNACLF